MERAELRESSGLQSITWLAIAAGGVLGAAVRWCLAEVIPPTDLPWSTFAANLLGCGLLARIGWRDWTARARAAAGVGFCGGLTTFSGVAIETVILADAGRWAAATLWPAACLASGLGIYLSMSGRRPEDHRSMGRRS